MSEFALIADRKGLFVYVQYPEEEKPRYTIDIIKGECECTGYTILQAKAAKLKCKPNNCKHLEELVFVLRQATIKMGKDLLKEKIG